MYFLTKNHLVFLKNRQKMVKFTAENSEKVKKKSEIVNRNSDDLKKIGNCKSEFRPKKRPKIGISESEIGHIPDIVTGRLTPRRLTDAV
jgi:hypothetical protein